MRLCVLMLLGAGCGADTKRCQTQSWPIEGQAAADPSAPPDRSCIGKTPVVSGCNTLHLCGEASEIVIHNPIDGATYEFYSSDGKLETSVQTDAFGAYCADVPVDAGGFVGRISLSKSGYRTHDGYLGAMPIGSSNDHVTLGIELETDLQHLLPSFGAIKPDPQKGIVDPFVLDCSFQWMQPVTVDIDRSYDKRYYIDAGPALKDSVPSSIAGQLSGALFVNVDPGPVTATFRSYATGELLATATGDAMGGHWTALPAFPNGH